MIAEGASDEEDVTGFNVCNKEVHEMVSMLKKWTPQTLYVK